MKTQLRKPARERARYTEEYKQEALGNLTLESRVHLDPVAAVIACFYHALPAKHIDRLPFRLPELANTRQQ
jgi:hypothetical protein